MDKMAKKVKTGCRQFLLPRHGRIVGVILLLAGIGLFIIPANHPLHSGYLGWYLMAIGLLIIACAREVVEDELIEMLRLKSFYISLTGSTLFVLTYDLIIHLDGSASMTTGVQLICLFLFIYSLWFRYELSRMNRQN